MGGGCKQSPTRVEKDGSQKDASKRCLWSQARNYKEGGRKRRVNRTREVWTRGRTWRSCRAAVSEPGGAAGETWGEAHGLLGKGSEGQATGSRRDPTGTGETINNSEHRNGLITCVLKSNTGSNIEKRLKARDT